MMVKLGCQYITSIPGSKKVRGQHTWGVRLEVAGVLKSYTLPAGCAAGVFATWHSTGRRGSSLLFTSVNFSVCSEQ